jgi:hypothetical protein
VTDPELVIDEFVECVGDIDEDAVNVVETQDVDVSVAEMLVDSDTVALLQPELDNVADTECEFVGVRVGDNETVADTVTEVL